MAGGPSKVNPPNSHPSNPIHKAVMAVQNPKPPKKVRFNLPNEEDQSKENLQETKKNEPHETNKIAIIFGAVAFGGLILLATR